LTNNSFLPLSDSSNPGRPSPQCAICASLREEKKRQEKLGRDEQVIEVGRLMSLHLQTYHKEKNKENDDDDDDDDDDEERKE
jgi:hypothetical protein